jgi:GDP-4-dehydro-6-deoxy-D-mannose reductase
MSAERVLVTGGSGYIGRAVLRHWRQQFPGAKLWATGSDDVDMSAHADEYHIVDLCVPAEVRRLMEMSGPSKVVHLAGRIAPGTLNEHLTVNAVATANLFQAIVDLGMTSTVRIVQAGTAAAYGPVTAAQLPVNETLPLRPVTPYALSKCAQELVAGMYVAQHGLNVVRARIFNLVGPGQGAHLVPATFIRQIATASKGGILETGNLDARRDFVDVRDVADALVRLVNDGVPGSVCNVGSGTSTAIRDVLRMLIDLSGRSDITVQTQPALLRGIDVPDIYADIRQIMAMTGWRPRFPLQQTLADMLEAAGVAAEGSAP